MADQADLFALSALGPSVLAQPPLVAAMTPEAAARDMAVER